MLTGNHEELDQKSEVMTRLLEMRQNVKRQLDEMSASVESSVQLSDNAAIQLLAVRRDYERAIQVFETRKDEFNKDYDKRIYDQEDSAGGTGAIVGAAAAVILAPFTGGLSLMALPAAGVVGFGVGSANSDEAKILASKKQSALKSIVTEEAAMHDMNKNQITSAESKTRAFEKQLHTHEQRKLYFGTIREFMLDSGVSITRQLQQYATFNGTTLDKTFHSLGVDLIDPFSKLFVGAAGKEDLDKIIEYGQSIEDGASAESRTIKQLVNHVIIPNQMYFDISASYVDDMHSQDLETFPHLEILGQKPITFSGRIQHEQRNLTPEQKQAEEIEFDSRAKAKVVVREVIAGNAVYSIMREDGLPHLQRMEALRDANELEIQQYAGVFSKIEDAMQNLAARQALLVDQQRGKMTEISEGERGNTIIDGRLHETNSRNQAKQKAATIAGRVRGGLALAGGAALALMDYGAVSGGVMAHGLYALKKSASGSIHSVTYAIGQEVSTSIENSALDDYMFSLQLQKADLPALRAELEAVQSAIAKTQKSKGFQAILKDEAKRSQVAETLLLRSLIRNGYNNSLEIEEICQHAGVESIDAFLDHYKGTRLGLALKKHCHGIADSNDMSVILAEANSLRGRLTGFDSVLKDYVEDTMKPNIASYYSKASKMDVVAQNNMTGFGNELHFSAEMQMETNRAVRVLLSSEFGMSVVGREDVRGMFDFWLHRHGDRRLYDEKIRDGEMSDEYPDKRVNYLPRDTMERFVDMAKRSVASGRTTFPKVGDMFMRVCAYEYFLPQAIQTGGKENIFTNYPESPSAYPMVNSVVSEFVRQLSFNDIADYRTKIGERLDNVVAQSFIDFFAKIGEIHENDPKLISIRNRLKDAANYDDYAPVFDRYTKNITRDAMGRFDLFLDIYKQNLEKQFECSTVEDRAVLEAQIDSVKGLADGKLDPTIIRPDTHEARLRAHDESHTGENMLRRG